MSFIGYPWITLETEVRSDQTKFFLRKKFRGIQLKKHRKRHTFVAIYNIYNILHQTTLVGKNNAPGQFYFLLPWVQWWIGGMVQWWYGGMVEWCNGAMVLRPHLLSEGDIGGGGSHGVVIGYSLDTALGDHLDRRKDHRKVKNNRKGEWERGQVKGIRGRKGKKIQ